MALSGPSEVRARMMSKAEKLMWEIQMRLTPIIGLMSGSVTRTKVCTGEAPSIEAAS